jgi:hypothetical protein
LRQDPEGGKNAEAGQQVELKVPHFDAVPYPKIVYFADAKTLRYSKLGTVNR